MKITNGTHPGDTTPATHSCKYYSEQELKKCLNSGHVSASAILSLIESHFEKDKAITELTQTIAELTKRIAYLEKKALQKPGRKRQTFWVNGRELTDEYLMELIDQGYYDGIAQLEKNVGASKNQLRNRYNKAKEKLRQERRMNSYGNR